MGKSIAQDEEETLQLGRKLLQIGGQEDTLAAIAASIGAGGVTPQILAQLDIKTSELRDGLRGAGTRDFTTLETDIEAILARLNVNLSTRASQTTIAAVLAQLNITQSAFRDAIRGPNTKNFSTLETDVEGILADTQVLNDDSLKGMLRSIGDAGAAPTNATGNTLLKLGDLIYAKLNTQLDITVSALRDALRGASTKDLTTLETELAKKVDGATTRATYTVTMTNLDTEYSQALPNNCLKFLIHTRDGTAFRIANVTGKVAGPAEPYFTIPANVPYWEDFIDPATMMLYFACASAGKIIELVAWA